MNAHSPIYASTRAPAPAVGSSARRPSSPFAARQRLQKPTKAENWDKRSEQWGCLMAAAQGGERQAYDQLLRELDVWLRRYYARRLPRPADEDARQDALLAIHANRYAYIPSKSFGAWVAAIARHKWIDRLREASRFAATTLHDEIPIEDHEEAAISAAAVDELLDRLKPAQASVIRLVKLQGASIEIASRVTGQSIALVKVNIHRGLKKLAKLAAARDAVDAPASSAKHCGRSASRSNHSPILSSTANG